MLGLRSVREYKVRTNLVQKTFLLGKDGKYLSTFNQREGTLVLPEHYMSISLPKILRQAYYLLCYLRFT